MSGICIILIVLILIPFSLYFLHVFDSLQSNTLPFQHNIFLPERVRLDCTYCMIFLFFKGKGGIVTRESLSLSLSFSLSLSLFPRWPCLYISTFLYVVNWILVGQLSNLLEDFKMSGNRGLSDDITARIRHLKTEATQISEEAVEFVRKGDEEYYKNLHFVVSRPWVLWRNQRELNFSMHWSNNIYFSNQSKADRNGIIWCM